MSVSNGQLANQNTFNTYLMSRTVDTDTQGTVGLKKTDAISGDHVLNAQRAINSFASVLGMTNQEVFDYLFNWPSNMVGSFGDTVLERIVALVDRFEGVSGHTHTGVDGEGAAISVTNLLNINQFFGARQMVTVNAAFGFTIDVSANFASKTPNGNSSQVGVVTTPPNNKVYIKDSLTETFIEDLEGQRVYGRITESGGAWTLSFFTNEAGTETAYDLTSTDIDVYFWEVFNQATRPTIPADPAEFGTLDITADVADASPTARGVLNPFALLQEMGGAKYWIGRAGFGDNVDLEGNIHFGSENDTSSTGSGVILPALQYLTTTFISSGLVSVAGITGDGGGFQELRVLANATGSDINIIHDDVGAGTDGFYCPSGVDFTWKKDTAILVFKAPQLNRWVISGGGGGSLFTLNTVGSTPNADGATYNALTGDFNLEPANSTNPGIVVNQDQIFPGGDKIFSNSFGGAGAAFSSAGSALQIPTSLPTLYILDNPGTLSINRIALPNLSNYAIFKVITNKTGNTVTILNDNGTPNIERIITGTGSDLKLKNNASIFIVREPGSARWHVVGGSGGGSFEQPLSTFVVGTGGQIAISLTDKFQFLKVRGNTAQFIETVSSTPFGTSAPEGGTVLKILGASDTNRFKLVYNNAAFGAILNGDAVFGSGSMMELIFDSSTNLWHECSRNF